MSRDYKKPEPKGRAGTMVLGVFIGLVLGLVAALAIAFYLNRAANPFASRDKPAGSSSTAPAKGSSTIPAVPATQTGGNGSATADAGKTDAKAESRFSFYTILPGVDQPVTDQELRNRKSDAKAPAQERIFLQAGAFKGAQDADNLKARLALMGMEASIQTVDLGAKGTWHRVRLGPFDDTDALARVRSQLAGNGIEAAPVKGSDKAP
jgi:cell division protein FtsN